MKRRTAKGAKTFNAIQDAAVELIYEHGFEKMTNQMLARRVRIKKATLYHHISSKEDLLFQILKRATSEGIREAIHAEVAKRPEEQLRLFIGALDSYDPAKAQLTICREEGLQRLAGSAAG